MNSISSVSMQIMRFILFFHLCNYSSILECSSECVSNSTKVYDDIEKLSISDSKENNRSKRASKPFTKLFDQLLGERLFNTTMNFIVPGAKVNLPRHTEEGSVDHLAMQAFFGIFWATAWLATIAVPVTTTYFQPLGIGRSVHEGDKNQFKFKWKLTKDVAEAIGLNWESCLQKSICQAHKFPEKYGMLGETIQVLFPADDNLDYNMIQHANLCHEAALKGAIGQDCTRIYNCFFDVLDVTLYIAKYGSATWIDWL